MSNMFKEVQIALDTQLSTLPSSPPVAWENVDYSPVDGTTYIRPTNLPAGAAALGMANTDSTRAAGFYQVDVLAPAVGGGGPALAIADSVAALFPRGTLLTEGDSTVIVGVPTQNPAIASGAWFMVSVLIPYDVLNRS